MASWRKRWQLVVVADDTGSGEAKAKEKLRLLEYHYVKDVIDWNGLLVISVGKVVTLKGDH